MLISDSLTPPGGWRFHEARTGQDFVQPSQQQLVAAVIKHRLANPRYKDEWATEWEAVRKEIHEWIGNQPCSGKLVRDWPHFWRSEGGEPPKTSALVLPRAPRQSGGAAAGVGRLKKWAKNTTAGIGVYLEWFGSDQPVSKEEAERRAAICVSCPMHTGPMHAGQRLTEMASTGLLKVLGILHHKALHTSLDQKLGVCQVCDCPMAAKVWSPIEIVRAHMTKQVKEQKPEHCWL